MAREERKLPPKETDKATLAELAYYFDAVERDRMDMGYLSRKNGHILALREKLLSLPLPEFDAAIKTIERLVMDVSKSDRKPGQDQKRREAIELFDKVSAGGTTTAALDKTSRV